MTKAMPICLFSDGVCISASKEGTDFGATKPAGASLPWTRGETLHQELGSWWTMPWQYRTKSLEGRTVMIYVGCCVFCVVVASSFS